ncbi:MAG TPA: hypothetical protein VLI55_08440 [Bryobacteraceae bacterium]|nr:hypothetical protein [Bryobacteraceae bacterium]
MAPHPTASAAAASRVSLRSQPSFWDDSLKMIRDGGWDIGSWLAYRRRLLVEASLTNRYFWFCITSYAANVLLIYLFYASRVSEDRKIWKATEAMTGLWNWALYADWDARKAIDKYNRHIDRCHSQANERSASNAATCGSANAKRSRRNFIDCTLLCWVLPWRCNYCHFRFFRLQWMWSV